MTCAALSGTGRRFVAATSEGEGLLYERRAGSWARLRKGPEGDRRGRRRFCVSPGGRRFAAVDREGKLVLCEFEVGKVVLTKETGVRNPAVIAFSPDSRLVAVCGDDWAIRLVPVATPDCKPKQPGEKEIKA